MSYARNLKFPTPRGKRPEQPKAPKANRGYTKIDAELDEPILQALPGALWPTAYYLMKFRHMRPVKMAEVELFTGKSSTQVKADLAKLRTLGHAVVHQGEWAWAGTAAASDLLKKKSLKVGRKTGRQIGRKIGFLTPENTVWYAKNLTPNEVELTLTKLKDNNIFVTGTLWPAQVAPGVAAGFAEFQEQEPETGLPEQLAPDGAASGEANGGDKPSPSQEKTVTGKAEIITEPSSEKVPPAAPATYGAAQAILTQMGAWAVWADWTRAHRLPNAAQDAQIVQFALWAQDGLLTDLALNASDITAAGSYSHPFPALKARMKLAQTCRAAQQREAEGAGRAGPEAQCQPGERRRDPQTGQVWTVEEVAYGNVTFEEGHAPMHVRDATVAGWEVLA